MHYYRAKEREWRQDAAFRIYLTKAAEILVKSVACCDLPDFSDLAEYTPKDTRSPEEIAADLIMRCDLELVE